MIGFLRFPFLHQAWQTTIRMLGVTIHNSSGTQLLNSLLSIAEKAFKTDNVEVRKETFKCWETLMDNFSLVDSTLNHQKRMKLLTRPLVVSLSTRTRPNVSQFYNPLIHFFLNLKNCVCSEISIARPNISPFQSLKILSSFRCFLNKLHKLFVDQRFLTL